MTYFEIQELRAGSWVLTERQGSAHHAIPLAPTMNSNKSLFSKIAAFMSAKPPALGSDSEFGAMAGRQPKDFDGDYRSAIQMLKERMTNRFPDNYHARVGTQANSTRDFGDERAEAIDTASAAIAAALRNGATAKQAAAAGAASVGI